MRAATLLAAALAAALALPGPAEARFDDTDARHACKQAARAQHGAQDFHHLTVANRGGGAYSVNGTMVGRNGANTPFTCAVRNGFVTDLSVDNSGSGGAAAAIGAALGVAVGAAILGAISNDHRHEDYRAPATPSWGGGGRSYSPARNITCHPRQRACYYKGDRFAPDWTSREFGRRPAQQPNRPSMSDRDMRRTCQGEASARFGRRPQEIYTQQVERMHGRAFVNGQFPAGRGRTGYFRCTFSADGRFLGIQRT